MRIDAELFDSSEFIVAKTRGSFIIRDSLYEGIIIMDNKEKEIPARVEESNDINGDSFTDCYIIVQSFKNIP